MARNLRKIPPDYQPPRDTYRLNDTFLALAEEACRTAGFHYPVGWALGWLSDNYETLWAVLMHSGNPAQVALAHELRRMVYELRTGNQWPDDTGEGKDV